MLFSPIKAIIKKKECERIYIARRKTGEFSTSIFDDVYRTIISRMPQFIIPVINDAFGTRYPMDIEFEQLKNEFYTKNGKIVSDSIFLIKGHIYHIECQSNPDNTMAIRMFEYGMEIALERARKKKDYLHVDLPESAVIFPFYVMRYENDLKTIEKDRKRLDVLLKEYIGICSRLEKVLEANGKSELYGDLVGCIMEIMDYMLRSQKNARKEMSKMGGKILETYTEKTFKAGGKNVVAAVNDIRSGMKPAELKKKYTADILKMAKSIA